MSARLNIGAHVSIAGGIDRAPARGREVGCDCIQIFTKSNLQWRARPLSEAEIARFKSEAAGNDIHPAVGHSSYLLNLASPDDALWRRSIASCLLELQRAERLGLPLLIAHAGSHAGAGEDAGMARLIAAIKILLQATRGFRVALCLEMMAGAGSHLCHRFEHFGRIVRAARSRRFGICLDTSHLHAAGYELRTKAGFAKTFAEFDRLIGLERLRAFHVNDSKVVFGSRVDRHEHIGKGQIGLPAFKFLMREPRFRNLPKIIETPKGFQGGKHWDIINLQVLRDCAQ